MSSSCADRNRLGMGKLTNVRMTTDSVLSLTTPEEIVLSSERSMVIHEVIVPPVATGPNETLSVIIGARVALEVPLRLLTDLYKAGRASTLARVCQNEEEPLSFVLKRCVMAWDDDQGRDPEQTEPANSTSRAIAVTQELVKAIENRPRMSLGFRLDRAILLPPRQSLTVESSEGSVVTVWLRGLMSEEPR